MIATAAGTNTNDKIDHNDNAQLSDTTATSADISNTSRHRIDKNRHRR
jgi:hypothetical protein